MAAKLKLLGRFELVLNDKSSLKITSKNAQAILAMLALSRDFTVTRDKLIKTLWASRSENQARNSLRQTLSALRKVFKQEQLEILHTDATQVQLLTQSIKIDALELQAFSMLKSRKKLESIVKLYRGDFLENLNARDSTLEQWIEAQRCFFQSKRCEVMGKLINLYLSHGEYHKVISLSNKQLTIDPLNERTHRTIMKAFWAQGDRAAALKQYLNCTEVLKNELSVMPSTKTLQLYESFLSSAENGDAEDSGGHIQQSCESTTNPAIAILPIKNLSKDSEQTCFCDGLTEQLITQLSRFRDLSVIASSSSFYYKDNNTNILQIAKDLGVGFILEGSVQKISSQLRITVQLIEVSSGIHLWTQQYDRDSNEVFKIQDEVTELIVGTLASVYGGRLRKAWQKQKKLTRPLQPQAFDFFMRGIDCANCFTKRENQQARQYFIKAIEIDPGYAKAYSGVACTHLLDASEAWADDYNTSLNKTLEFATKAIECDDSESWSYWQLAVYYIYTRQHDLAMIEFEKAINLNPNDAEVLTDAGYYYSYCGKVEKALAFANKGMKLNPHYPEYYTLQMAQIHFDAHRYEDAITWYRKAHRTDTTLANLYLAASYAAIGNKDESTKSIDQALQMDKQATLKKWTNHKLAPYKNPEDLNHFKHHLELAGFQ